MMKKNKKRGNPNWGGSRFESKLIKKYSDQLCRDNGYPIKKTYIVMHPGLTSLKRNQIISQKKLKKSKIDFGWEKNYQTFSYKLYV